MKQKNVVITGGSSGIGLELAKSYASKDVRLMLIARDMEKLERVRSEITASYPSTSVEVYAADVSVLDEVQEVFEKIRQNCAHIDVLICGAGVMTCGRLEDQEPSLSKKSFDINYWGTHYAIYQFLPLLKLSKNAKVGIISSVAGYTGLFGYTHYAPSKFALAGLAESLRMEFKDYAINVSVIYPPDTETPFLEYERANTLPECKALSAGARSISSEKAAKVIMKGLEKGKFEIYFNLESRFIRVLKGLMPTFYYYLLDRIVRKSRKKSKQTT